MTGALELVYIHSTTVSLAAALASLPLLREILLGWALHTLHPEEGWLHNTLVHTADVAKWSSVIIMSVMLGNAWVNQVCVSQLHQDEPAAIMPPLQDQMWVSHSRSLLFCWMNSSCNCSLCVVRCRMCSPDASSEDSSGNRRCLFRSCVSLIPTFASLVKREGPALPSFLQQAIKLA